MSNPTNDSPNVGQTSYQMALKPLLSGATSIFIEKYICQSGNALTTDLYFGAAVAAGTYAAPMINSSLGIDNQQFLISRGSEALIGAGSAYAVNRYLLNNEYLSDDIQRKVSICLISDFVADYLVDLMDGQDLNPYGQYNH